jgi:hypothetical protein
MVDKNSDIQLNSHGDMRGMSPNSRKNLEKRNLKGNNNAKSLTITSTIRSMLDDLCPERWLPVEDKDKGLTYRQAIAKTILNAAVSGKPGIISELLDRLEGKVVQPIGGEGGQPIEVNIGYRDKILSAISRQAEGSGEREDNQEP